MPTFEVEVKPFSTSEVIVSLEWGQVVDGSFQSNGPLYKKPEFKSLYTKSTSGKFGKPSFEEIYAFNVPDDFKYAIAGKKRTGVGTTTIEMVYDVLFTPRV